MKHVLARAQRERLERLSRSRALLGFDFDGTLAPFAADPARARMRAPTRRLLARVARLYPVVVISGRARADLAGRLRGVPVAELFGNHGIEPWANSKRFAARVRRWSGELRPRLGGLARVWIEDKTYSLSVHFRAARDRAAARAARAAILRAAAGLGGVRIVGGKRVLNFLPAGAPGKGAALARARRRLGCEMALYVGDDETDEDVFALAKTGWLLGVRVGPRRGSHAGHCIRGQAEIDALLRTLVDLRLARRRRRLV